MDSETLELLRCPATHRPLQQEGDELFADERHRYAIHDGIPLFATHLISADGESQRAHYDRIAQSYVEHLDYPHTREYTAYLDDALLSVVDRTKLRTVAEICCGRGEAFHLVGRDVQRGVGVDISEAMLRRAMADGNGRVAYVQGDATMLPLADAGFDAVFMLGGIHHVRDRLRLFQEVQRILKPGGHFYFREPVSDFFLWKWLRAVIYRLSPSLDHQTERPLQHEETVPVLQAAGLRPLHYRTHGFLGFCLLMNSDVLVFNKLFRFIPGIRLLARAMARLDEFVLQLPGFKRMGLQVVGLAIKPEV